MKNGLILIAVSIVWYIAHAVIYNYYLQKNNPGLFDELEKPRKKQKNERILTRQDGRKLLTDECKLC